MTPVAGRSTRPKVVVVGQTPPPFGGQAVMIKALVDGDYDAFDLVHVRMNFSHDVGEIGVFRLGKVLHLASTVLRIALARMRGCRTLYYPPAGPNIVPICRDIAILLATRWMFRADIFHFHASGVSEAYDRLPALLRPLYRRAYCGADVGIRMSDLTPDDAGALGAEATHVVPYGVPDHVPAEGPPRPCAADVPVLLYVGVLCESKGVLVLLEACARLMQRGVRFRLALVGAPQPAAFGQLLTEAIDGHGLGDNVELCGVRSGQEKWLTYGAASVFCFPTFFESEAFPVVLLEAMQFELPVVASRWRGIPSMVEDGRTGFLVAPGDAVELAERIETLLNDRVLAEGMGRRGRARFLDRFTIEVFRRNMEDVIASVTGPTKTSVR